LFRFPEPLLYTGRYTTDPSGIPGIKEAAETYAMRHLGMLDDVVKAGPFLLGPTPMGVDFLIWVILSWLDREKVAGCAPRLLVLADAVTTDAILCKVAARHL
jgi:glutathione S-transferase